MATSPKHTEPEMITKPAQGGKFKSTVEWIANDQKMCKEEDKREKIVIVFHGQTKSLGGQTSSRIASDKDTFDPSKVVLWNSGKTGATVTGIRTANYTPTEMFGYIVRRNVKYILCCDVKRRWDYVSTLLEIMEEYIKEGGEFPGFRVVVDEADAFTHCDKFIKKYKAFVALDDYLEVTATPEDNIKRHGSLKILPQDQPINPEIYVGCAEQDWTLYDINHSTAIEYIKKLWEIEFQVPNVIPVSKRFVPGSIWYVPANVACDTHDEVVKFMLGKEANIAIINGKNKKIFFHDGSDPIDLKDEIAEGTDELGAILKRYWLNDDRLQTSPFIITGNKCIGRGISFQDPHEGKFIFDTAIVPEIQKRKDAYQAMARMFGNIKKVRGSHRARIFTTSSMKKKAEDGQKLSIGLNRVAKERPDNKVTIQDVTDILKNRDHLKRYFKTLVTFDEVITFSQKIWNHTLSKRGRSFTLAPEELLVVDSVTKKVSNPTEKNILDRWWGLDKNNPCRAVLTNDMKWCVYGWITKEKFDELTAESKPYMRTQVAPAIVRKRPQVAPAIVRKRPQVAPVTTESPKVIRKRPQVASSSSL